MGVLKDGYEILLDAWRAIRERGAGRSVARGAWTVEEWLVPELALDRYASPALLEARDKELKTFADIRDKQDYLPLDEVFRQGLDEKLEDAYRRYGDFERRFEYDACEKLLSGELIARGFREPFAHGAPYVTIARHEWHILRLKMPNRAEGGGVAYVALEIGKPGTRSFFRRKR